jgi:hypothetical protein
MNEHGSRFGGSGGDRIDRAIDRAVRDMMWTDPPAGLWRRVLSRLEAPLRRPSLLPRFALAAAALVVVSTVAVLLRQSSLPPANAPRSTAAFAGSTKTLPPPSRVAPPTPPAAPDAAATRRTPPRRSSLIRMPAIGNVFGPSDGRVSGATLVEPGAARSLTIEGAIDPRPPDDAAAAAPPWAPAPLTLAPLEVKPLQIAPLPPRW